MVLIGPVFDGMLSSHSGRPVQEDQTAAINQCAKSCAQPLALIDQPELIVGTSTNGARPCTPNQSTTRHQDPRPGHVSDVACVSAPCRSVSLVSRSGLNACKRSGGTVGALPWQSAAASSASAGAV